MSAAPDDRSPPQEPLATDALDYELPPQRIATRPSDPRDAARLLVYRRGADASEHLRVRDLPDLLERDDTVVLNDTAVARARLNGRRMTGGRVDGLFLRDDGGRWEVMLRSNGRLHAEDVIELVDRDGRPTGRRLALETKVAGHWWARLEPPGPAAEVLESLGRTPLPPYIVRRRTQAPGDAAEIADEQDRAWYQTVFAAGGAEARRSVAAPTAGLHFTPELLRGLERRGVRRLSVTLHVGPGTFAPVTAAKLAEHEMHAEWFAAPPAALDALRARAAGGAGGRLVAVGTTVVRTLESLPEPLPPAGDAATGQTRLMIAPPYRFRHVDALLTNFHLPRSTLLALVAAMIGLERVQRLYREAIEREYRFYSYGDAMLILP